MPDLRGGSDLARPWLSYCSFPGTYRQGGPHVVILSLGLYPVLQERLGLIRLDLRPYRIRL